MLKELADGSKNMGQNINKSKTKVMMENDRCRSSMLRPSPNHGTLRLHSGDDDDDYDDDDQQRLHKDLCLICQIYQLCILLENLHIVTMDAVRNDAKVYMKILIKDSDHVGTQLVKKHNYVCGRPAII